MFDRWYGARLKQKLARPFVHLIFGARQTGKTTLAGALLPADAVRIDLSDPAERSRHLADPGEFGRLCRALSGQSGPRTVFVDEAQTVPTIFDAVQSLFDADKRRFRFVLCGSSARRLRLTGANLLPGRSFLHHLYPLTLAEHPPPGVHIDDAASPLPFPWDGRPRPGLPFPAWDLEERLTYGALPGIVTSERDDRADLLRAFAIVHLEEEIRREGLVRDWGAFVRFLRLAATESGQILNYTAISQEAGISQPTVKSHYQLLEDMFIGFRVMPYSKSRRKNLLSTPRFVFFDLGVRHAAAGLTPSVDVARAQGASLFEQWVGIELWKRLNYLGEGQLYFQRTRDGAEIDFIVEHRGEVTPIEVKWTERPVASDARHLLAFLAENRKAARRAFIICRCPRPLQIHGQVTALPWFNL